MPAGGAGSEGRADQDRRAGHGYAAVDDGDTADLVATMDAVSRWASTRALRAWERERLALRPGERLLDVGCGPGDVAVALAAVLGPDGDVVGVDSSEAMVAVARERAAEARCRLRAVVGDAAALDEPDRSFDAARSERTLQWVPGPGRVVAELHRVLRPGGRLVLIDTDWSTLAIDTGDDDVAAALRAHVGEERRRPSHVGRRLWGLCRAAGLTPVEAPAATQVWTRWDPDRGPAPDGLPPIAGLVDDLVASGHVPAPGAPAFLAAIEDAARDGRLLLSLTMYSVAARRP